MTALQRAADEARVVCRVQGEPSVFQPWFTATPVVDHRTALAADRVRGAAFSDRLLEAGIVKAHEKLFLSTAHGEEEIASTVAAFAFAMEHIAALP